MKQKEREEKSREKEICEDDKRKKQDKEKKMEGRKL
jgi:hypothetical protein